MFGKRGLSQVVTTVLIILLVLVAVLIIWGFVRPTIEQTGGQIGIGTLTTSLELTKVIYIPLDTEVVVDIKRNAGKGDLVAINVVVTDENGNSKVYRHITTLQELGSETVTVILADIGFDPSVDIIKEVSIAPVIKTSSGEVIGAIVDTKKPGFGGGGGSLCGNGNPDPGEQCDLGNQNGVPGSGCTSSCEIEGLIAYWNFESNVLDQTENGNDGTINGAPVYVPGVNGIGQGLQFDGVQDYVDLSSISGFSIYGSGPFSISFWVNGPQQDNKIMFSEGSSISNAQVFFLGTDTPLVLPIVRLFIRNDSNTVLFIGESSSTAFDDTWHHVVYTDDGSGNVGVYIDDGILDSSFLPYVPGTLTLDRASIGALWRVLPTNFFSGTIDDMRVYNKVLTQGEVTTLFNQF